MLLLTFAFAVLDSQPMASSLRLSMLTYVRPARKLFFTYLTTASDWPLLAGSYGMQNTGSKPAALTYLANSSVIT